MSNKFLIPSEIHFIGNWRIENVFRNNDFQLNAGEEIVVNSELAESGFGFFAPLFYSPWDTYSLTASTLQNCTTNVVTQIRSIKGD